MDQVNGRGKMIAGIAGIVLFLDMFVLGWFGAQGHGFDAYEALGDWATIILTLTTFAAFALVLFDQLNQIDTPLSVIVTGLGVISAIIILIEIISKPDFHGVSLSSEFGAWLGLIAAIGVGVGGYLTMTEEGVTFTE